MDNWNFTEEVFSDLRYALYHYLDLQGVQFVRWMNRDLSGFEDRNTYGFLVNDTRESELFHGIESGLTHITSVFFKDNESQYTILVDMSKYAGGGVSIPLFIHAAGTYVFVELPEVLVPMFNKDYLKNGVTYATRLYLTAITEALGKARPISVDKYFTVTEDLRKLDWSKEKDKPKEAPVKEPSDTDIKRKTTIADDNPKLVAKKMVPKKGSVKKSGPDKFADIKDALKNTPGEGKAVWSFVETSFRNMGFGVDMDLCEIRLTNAKPNNVFPVMDAALQGIPISNRTESGIEFMVLLVDLSRFVDVECKIPIVIRTETDKAGIKSIFVEIPEYLLQVFKEEYECRIADTIVKHYLAFIKEALTTPGKSESIDWFKYHAIKAELAKYDWRGKGKWLVEIIANMFPEPGEPSPEIRPSDKCEGGGMVYPPDDNDESYRSLPIFYDVTKDQPVTRLSAIPSIVVQPDTDLFKTMVAELTILFHQNEKEDYEMTSTMYRVPLVTDSQTPYLDVLLLLVNDNGNKSLRVSHPIVSSNGLPYEGKNPYTEDTYQYLVCVENNLVNLLVKKTLKDIISFPQYRNFSVESILSSAKNLTEASIEHFKNSLEI